MERTSGACSPLPPAPAASAYPPQLHTNSTRLPSPPDASDAPMAALVNPVGDSIRASVRFGVSAATSPRAVASLGRRIAGAAVRSYGKLLWRMCVLWPLLASYAPSVLRVCVRASRNLIRYARASERAAAATKRREAGGGEAAVDGMTHEATHGLQGSAASTPSTAERVRQGVRQVVTYLLPGWREGVNYWLVRPAMRLSALVVERTAQTLPAGTGLSARSAGSDGLVDTAGQRGVDVPFTSAGRRAMGALRVAEGLQTHHSSECLESLGGGDTAGAERSRGRRESPDHKGSGKGKGLPQRGKWWVLNVHNSDHSLGTALCQDSGLMYESVLAVLEKLPPLDTRELMRLRAARLSEESVGAREAKRWSDVVRGGDLKCGGGGGLSRGEG